MTQNKYDTVIVGAGMAGLTSAAYLSRAGQKVLLIEKNRECGGLVNSFTRDGFHFDGGVRALEDAGIIFPMLKDLDIDLDVVKSPVSLGIEDKILHIENLQSLKEYENLLRKLYPESESEIAAVLKKIRRIMKHMDVLYGIENPVFKDLKRDRSFIFTKLLPWLPKFLLTVGKINRMNMPVENYLDNLVTNPSLKDIISQHFFKGTPTFFALSYFSLYLDYFYPKGGMKELSTVLENKILEHGGEIKRETEISHVAADQRFVRDQHQSTYAYDHLIWAADLKTLYRIVETGGVAPKIQSNLQAAKSRILKSRGGDSVFTLFIEVDEPLESFRRIAHGHFFYTPSRQGLGETHRAELQKLLQGFADLRKEDLMAWLDKFTALNTYEISIPGLRDPELAPKGKTGLIVSLLAEYDLFVSVQEAGWYDGFKKALEKRMVDVLSDSVYPFLKSKMITCFSFTPLSIANRIGSSEGAITGWSFEKAVPVVNKIQYSSRSVLTPIPAVFVAGQWAYSPAGVPMAILTGKLATEKILKK